MQYNLGMSKHSGIVLFYSAVRVKLISWLQLSKLALGILELQLDLLGIEVPERM